MRDCNDDNQVSYDSMTRVFLQNASIVAIDDIRRAFIAWDIYHHLDDEKKLQCKINGKKCGAHLMHNSNWFMLAK